MKIVDISLDRKAELRLDPYLPVQVIWGEEGVPVVHWQTGDLSRTLLDIEVDPPTGEVRGLTLVLAGTVTRAMLGDSLGHLPTAMGVPMMGVRPTERMYIAEPGELSVMLGNGNVVMRFAGRRAICRTITSGQVRFGVDEEQRLGAIEVYGLTGQDMASLAERLAPHLAQNPERTQGERDGARPEWFEVWFDLSYQGDRLLTVRGYSDGHVVITDPQAGNVLVEAFDTYEEARVWLGDEEYFEVRGRYRY